jgi:ABC-type multidrug transport system fused ATPase/permease subunit
MDVIWKGSIKRTLMRISMLTTCVALLLTSVLLIANEVITFRQSLIERMGMMANVIGTNSTAALMFNDKKTAEETLYALKSGKNITCAVLYNRKGDVLAQYIRDVSARNCHHHRVGPDGYHLGIDHLDILQRIHLDNESIGTLYIESDLNELYHLILWFLVTVFMVILLSTAIAFVLMSRLQKIITKPLSEMVDVMNTVSGKRIIR